MKRGAVRPRLAMTVALAMIAGMTGLVDPYGMGLTGWTHASDFVEVTEEAGLDVRHFKPILDSKLDNIMAWVSSVGGAAAAADFDRDGWIDLYVSNSRKGKPNRLYRNNGDGTFTDVAAAAGVASVNDDGGTTMDCVWGDVDNDGWKDLYVVRWGRDVLFLNRGDGTFEDVTAKRFERRDGSPGTQWANGNAAIFLDYNLDGRLDIYLGNYFDEVDLWNLEDTRIMHDDFETSRNGGVNFLYRQEADGTFTEVGEKLGVDDPGWTLAVGSADLNNDGWVDLYCADDFGPDQLFLNDKEGGFRNVSETAIGPDTKKGMNVDTGDVNNDGWLDIYVTNITTAEYLQEGNMLWHNNGIGEKGVLTFSDISLETGTYDGGWGWGAKFFDYENDGDLDIISVNGFISAGEESYWYALASWTVTGDDPTNARNWPPIGNMSFSGYETTRFWRNQGFFAFSEQAESAGLASQRDGRGVVCWDYDNDGDIDLFVANQDQKPHLYRNESRTGNHWLAVSLEADPATGINRDAIGARVTVVTDSSRQIRELDGGNGFSGQSDPRLHFGLGSAERVRLLEVRWPDGGLQYRENVEANQFVTIGQDSNRYAARMIPSASLPEPVAQDSSSGESAIPEISEADLDAMLIQMEEQLKATMPNYGMASTYRARCVDYSKHNRAIRFFRKWVNEEPGNARARLELACAYIDKIATCGGIAAIVCKGRLASKSLDQLKRVIAADPNSWVGYYTRGMNHLHWPRALRHTNDAIADLRQCLTIQKERGDEKDYYVRTYIALGDAYAKKRQFDQAIEVWKAGLKRFPGSEALKERLKVGSGPELAKYVQSERSLQKPIDTNLSFLDQTE